MENNNNKINSTILYTSRERLLSGGKIEIIEKTISAKHILDILEGRHNYLCRIEKFVADNPVLLEYYVEAEEEVAKSGIPYMAAIFITALEKIAEDLLDYKEVYNSSESVLIEKINKLNADNKKLKSKLNKITEIFEDK